jgi:hypothetical protein
MLETGCGAGGHPMSSKASRSRTDRTDRASYRSSLWRGWTRLQDPEDDMILVFSFRKFCISNLFTMLDSMLQKASIRGDPYYLVVW